MPKSSILHITHDSFVKLVLSNPAAGQDFLNYFLPESLKGNLDIEKCVPSELSYLTESMRNRHTDLIFDVPIKGSGEGIRIAILIEHKSYKDEAVIFQLLEYLALGYRKQSREKKGFRLIIPLLYYHGKQEWSPAGLSSYFIDIPGDLKPFLPEFSRIYIDLKNYSIDDIERLNNSLLRTALYIQLLRLQNMENKTILSRAFTTFEYGQYRNYFSAIFVYAIKYLDLEKEEFEILVDEFPEEVKPEAMTLANRLKREGMEEGIEIGKKQGIEKGIEKGIELSQVSFVFKSYENGLDALTIAKIVGITEDRVREILNIER